MNGAEYMGEAGVSLVSERDSPTRVPVLPLTDLQKLASERRAAAEGLLAEARDFEQQLAALAAVANAAIACEREAAQRSRLAREHLAAVATLRRAEETAAAEFTAAQAHLENARAAYDAAVSARSAQLSADADAPTTEANAQAEADIAAGMLREAQDARGRADAQLLALRGLIEADSGANDLSAEALRRMIERRAADALRRGAQRGAP